MVDGCNTKTSETPGISPMGPCDKRRARTVQEIRFYGTEKARTLDGAQGPRL